jgi:hypothetical protein
MLVGKCCREVPKAEDGADLAEDVLQRLFCLIKWDVSNYKSVRGRRPDGELTGRETY